MQKVFVITSLSLFVLIAVSFSNESLRSKYSRPASQWPAPNIDNGIEWKELGILPESPLENSKDSLKNIIELGKSLFFDTRLSGSGKISCATCHDPALNWTDGKEKSIGHEGTINKRNSPTIQNTWFFKSLFWDGRSKTLEDQAFAPINSESEMHSEMPDLIMKLRNTKEYPGLFTKAFGSPGINPNRMTEAIAIFERTIVSNKSKFDHFLAGERETLSNSELRGLHLFRTKARCMNCHNGSLFSDNQFHNNGIQLNGNPENDKGLFTVTHKDEDVGKFKTPSLRDVTKTGPWMHNGKLQSIEDVLHHYNKGANKNSSADPKIRVLHLSKRELKDLGEFLKAISAPPVEFKKPSF